MNVALRIEDYLKSLNIKCEVISFGENRANLIAYLNENLEGKNLLYNGHMDVVPPGDLKLWKTDPYEVIEKDGRLRGRGVEDNLGALDCRRHRLPVEDIRRPVLHRQVAQGLDAVTRPVGDADPGASLDEQAGDAGAQHAAPAGDHGHHPTSLHAEEARSDAAQSALAAMPIR